MVNSTVISAEAAAALGFRVHSGWAIMVAVAGSPGRPVVLERRRIETADAAIPGSKQPYHSAERLDLQEAETLIRECRDSCMSLTGRAVGAMAAQLARSGRVAVRAGVLFASGRSLPDLAATLKSHALIHTAEGEFFREAVVRACEKHSLPVTRVKEREVWDRGAAAFRLDPTDLRQTINELRRPLGPPWSQDEKLASLAAWIALAATT
ncbi:MAG: hypothetical protein EXQ52_14845 [Bryobacterales bacterium]|nr:hypothetical protein [Bryobacterales bacterium]